MRKLSGYYLIALGTLEVVFYVLRESVPFIVRPHAALLWSSFFAESDVRSNIASLSICMLVFSAGIAMLTKRKWAAIPYCIAGGLIAIVDLYFPLAIMIFGGHFVTFGYAVVMWMAALVYDAIPVSMTLWTVTRST